MKNIIRKLLVFMILWMNVKIQTGHNCKILIHRQHLTADCKNKGLHSVPQDLNNSITALDLSGNKLQILQNNSFQRYEHLSYITLYNNQLSILHKDAFNGLGKLGQLSISQNKLDLSKSYIEGVFRHISSLSTLDLRYNFDKSHTNPVPIRYPYFGDLHNLEELFIDLLPIPVFKNSGFNTLNKLRVLRFDKCHLLNMRNNTFKYFTNSVKIVFFRGCQHVKDVEADFLKPFSNLKALNMQDSYIHISRALKLLLPFENKTMEAIMFTKVTVAFLDSEQYPYAAKITRDMMKHLQTICVEILALNENGIVDFEPGSLLTYERPDCFKRIEFIGNRFSLLTGVKMKEFLILKARLVNLKYFELSYNPIKYLDIKFYKSPNRIKINAVDEHDDDDYIHSTNLNHGEKSSSGTVILGLPPALEELRMSHFMGGKEKRAIRLYNASNLRRVDISYFQMQTFPDVNFEGPSKLSYLDVSGIDSNLYYFKTTIPLFRNLKTVVMQDVRLAVTLGNPEGSRIFKFIPSIEDLDISRNNLFYLPTDAFVNNKGINRLHIEFNLLSEIPIAITSLPELRYLDVTYNRIETINKTLRDWMDQHQKRNTFKFNLYIAGNYFKCNCDTADFIEWVFKTHVVFDSKPKHYKCLLKNGTHMRLDLVYEHFHELFSHCNSLFWLRFGIGCLVGFVCLAVPVAIIFNLRFQIAYLIYRKFKRVVEKGLRRKFKYDIYVAYADDSIDWIKNTLVPKIEESWKLKMCLEDRDFFIGVSKADAIAKAIRESRYIFFILSKRFRNKEWGNFEIDMAKFEKSTKQSQKIIVITRDITPEYIPEEFDYIWKDVTFIEWGTTDNEQGWDKLRLTLFAESL